VDFATTIAGHVLDLHRHMHAIVAGELRDLAGGRGSIAIALGTALVLGMVHALTPGHGKVVLLAYFLGRTARPWAGVAAAAQIAALHVGSAVLLVTAVGATATAFGRPTGVAAALQSASAVAVTALGCWYLWQAIRRGQTAATHHSHSGISLAVGLLPCPLTMLILSAAFAHASIGIGLLLVLGMGFGIMATISLVGSLGIAAQRGLAAGIGGTRRFMALVHGLEVASALVILVLGISALGAQS
jgi:ABC-type nickel/cobalt efflux system permease component RcnA